MQESCHAQIDKWPPRIEQILGCTPTHTLDTVASNYRHTIDGYADKISVTQGDSIGIVSSVERGYLVGVINSLVRLL